MKSKPIDNSQVVSQAWPNNAAASPKQVLSDFCDYTSTHGPSHVKRVKNIFGKLVWLVAILTFTGILAWQLIILITDFKRSDYNVLLEVKFNKSLPFPAVTLCNMNAFRSSYFAEVANNNEPLKTYYEAMMSDFNQYSETEETNSYDYEFWEERKIDYDAYEEAYEEEMYVRKAVNTFNHSTKMYIGHKLESMLLSCTYAGKMCNIRNFTHFWNHMYGSCFTFYGENTEVSTAGPAKGLEIVLYIEVNEYMTSINSKAGLKLVVHEHNRVPFPDKDGISVSAGFSTDIGIRMLEVQRLGSPYYECLPKSTAGKENIYSHHKKYEESYNLDVCEISCYQFFLVKNCGCVDSTYPVDHPSIAPNLSYCFDVNPMCASIAFDNYTSGRMQCSQCKQACKETKFYTTVSSSVWPTPQGDIMSQFRKILLEQRNPELQMWLQSQENLTDSERYTDIRNNVAKIVLFYEDLNYERIIQTPAFTTISFISNLGGLFGLWIGMSVLSLCEWLEFLIRMFFACIRKWNTVGLQPN